MLSDQRFILSRDIPLEVALVFALVALIAGGFAIWGFRTGGGRGEDILRGTAVVLCGLGLFVAGYIGWNALIVDEPIQCAGGGGGCGRVEESEYARFLGIHMSIWGLIGYLTILAATLWRGDLARLTMFGLSIFGFMVSLILRYLELWEIQASCQWCVASAVLMTMLLFVSTLRLFGYYGTDTSGPGPADGDDDEPRVAASVPSS